MSLKLYLPLTSYVTVALYFSWPHLDLPLPASRPCREPLNLGSTEMVSMNDMMGMVCAFDEKKLPIKHIPGPEGVRGRNSDSVLILEKLGWEPTISLNDGLKVGH